MLGRPPKTAIQIGRLRAQCANLGVAPTVQFVALVMPYAAPGALNRKRSLLNFLFATGAKKGLIGTAKLIDSSKSLGREVDAPDFRDSNLVTIREYSHAGRKRKTVYKNP